VEVETPAMQAIPGGAAAAPFKTFHNALGCDFYLRIALELYHKRLLVGGIDKLFEIGKNFRNEGLSRRHNPEFTMLEAYCAFGDYESMMETVEALITRVAEKVLGTLLIRHERRAEVTQAIVHAHHIIDLMMVGEHKADLSVVLTPFDLRLRKISLEQNAVLLAKEAAEILVGAGEALNTHLQKHNLPTPEFAHPYQNPFHVLEANRSRLTQLAEVKEIDLKRPWRRARYKDLIREKAGLDWFDLTPAQRRAKAEVLGAEIGKEYEDFEVTGAVFEKLIEPTLIQPTFVTHLPKELVPLAKLSPDDPTTVEVFECCINGQEIAPGYTEQNDPIAQRNTLEHQAGGEQQKLDEDFLVALEHGMPPAGGIGIGIDRLCMMLLGQESIRDVILFPQLKPK